MKKRNLFMATATAITVGAGSLYLASNRNVSKPAAAPKPQNMAMVTHPFAPILPRVTEAPVAAPSSNTSAVVTEPSQISALIAKIRMEAARMDALLSDNDKALIEKTFSSFDPSATCGVEIQELPSSGNGSFPAYNDNEHLLSYVDQDGKIQTRDALVWTQSDECHEAPGQRIMGVIREAYLALDKIDTRLKANGFSSPQYQMTVSVKDATGGTALSFACQGATDGTLRCSSPTPVTPPEPRSYNIKYMIFDPVTPTFTPRPSSDQDPNP